MLGLDKDFQIIQIMRYTNLQWNRKYHESGDFIMQLPLEQYTTDLQYIYTKDRPEMGKIKERKYISLSGYSYIELRGTFLEDELSRLIVYPLGVTNITNAPTWDIQKGKAEDVALAFYDAFRKIETKDASFELDIEPDASLGRGHDAEHGRNCEDLAYKMYDILKPSGMSYRVTYDLNNNTKKLSIWSGLDRTQDNEDGNNPIIFSTKYKNIYKPNVLIDDTDNRNACIIVHGNNSDNSADCTVEAYFAETADERNVMVAYSSVSKSEYSAADFIEALKGEAINELAENTRVINMEFDAMAGSYEYGVDFNLGDMCSVEIPDMGLTADVRLIGCYEVMKDGGWKMTMEFGKPLIK